jgi:molybdenum cofactor synthesis domain-containing protein
MYRAAVITASDKGYAGQREDTGGPLVAQLLKDAGYDVVYASLVPDDPELIKAELIKCADGLDIALTVTTGGTGFSPRDNTPEATIAVCQRLVPGIPEAMRYESMKITPHGMLSRAQAGIRGRTLIINLPGSPKAIKENLAVVIPALRHGLDTLRGEKTDCAVK